MHNYLKTLDTNCTIKVKLKLKPIIENGAPTVAVRINDSFLVRAGITEEVAIVTDIGLMDNLEVSITMDGKRYSADKETAVIIEEFTIDGISMLPLHTGHAVYTNDQNYNEPTNYLGFNGTWAFILNEPFYHWRHAVTGQGWLLTP